MKTFNQISKSFNYFTFPIVNLPFISSNIPAQPAYVIYMSKLIRYSRDRVQHSDFLDIVQLLTQKLPQKGYVAPMLKSSQKKKIKKKKNSSGNGSFLSYVDFINGLSTIDKTFTTLIYE